MIVGFVELLLGDVDRGFRPLRLFRAAQAERLQHLAQRARTEAHQPVGGRVGGEIDAGVDQRGRVEHCPRRADPGAVPARGAEVELAGEGRSGGGEVREPADPGLPQLSESRRSEDVDVGVDDLDAVGLAFRSARRGCRPPARAAGRTSRWSADSRSAARRSSRPSGPRPPTGRSPRNCSREIRSPASRARSR